jgi:hypothetical protein
MTIFGNTAIRPQTGKAASKAQDDVADVSGAAKRNGDSCQLCDLTVDATIFGVLTVPYHIQKCGRLVVFFYALPEVRLPGR